MRWIGRRQSENIEDRRGGRALRVGIGGGLGTLVIVVLVMLLGGDPQQLLENLPQEAQVEDGGTTTPYQETSAEAEVRSFVSVVLADTEDTWHQLFAEKGMRYEDPKLVLFTGAVDSDCGFAQSAVGPFYCPANRKVYLDLSFFQELRDRFGASGDFAQAYVVAHEIGHHVQTILGIADAYQDRGPSALVRVELQADCLAGVWASHAERGRDLLEAGDIEEGLRAAAAIGDDRVQMQTQGYVAPDSFTHGSSEQRVRWFQRGVEGGTIEDCDTMSAPAL